MKNTDRLVGIALAVLALEGCRGSQQHAEQTRPQPSPSPTAFARGGHVGGHIGGGAVFYGAGAGAAGAASARQYGHDPAAGTDRTLGRGGGYGTSADGEAGHGGFGDAGAHGAGG
jgi:hypothetical protein